MDGIITVNSFTEEKLELLIFVLALGLAIVSFSLCWIATEISKLRSEGKDAGHQDKS